MRALVCAATRAELSAVQKGLAVGTLTPLHDTLLTGVGPRKARAALLERLADGKPELIVSTGFAGAVVPRLKVGDWVTTSRFDARLAPDPAIPCAVFSTDDLVLDSAPDGAEAVDMESEGLAEVAASHAIPFMVLRLISDSREKPLPKFLVPFTSAMATSSVRAKLSETAKGVRGALADPLGVARLVREGTGLAHKLADGWSRFALQL